MAFVAGAIQGNLILDTSGFTGGITAAISAATSGAGGISGPLLGAASAIASAFKSAFSFIVDAVMSVGKRFDDMGEAAEKAGVSTEFLSRVGLAAQDSGSSLQGLGDALKFLNKNMSEAAGGSKDAQQAFAAIGISTDDLKSNLGDTEGMFRTVVERVGQLDTTADKTAATMNLLGRSGSELIPLMNAGAEGLDKWAEMSDKLGNTVTAAQAKQGDNFGTMMTQIGAAMEGIKAAIAEPILQALGGADKFGPIISKIAGAIKTIIPPVLAVVAFGVEAILFVAEKLLIPFQILGHIIDAIGSIFGAKWKIGDSIGQFREGLTGIRDTVADIRHNVSEDIKGGSLIQVAGETNKSSEAVSKGHTTNVTVNATLDPNAASSQIADKLRPGLVEAAERQTTDLQGAARRALVARKTGGNAS